jgi:hypothetical protein
VPAELKLPADINFALDVKHARGHPPASPSHPLSCAPHSASRTSTLASTTGARSRGSIRWVRQPATAVPPHDGMTARLMCCAGTAVLKAHFPKGRKELAVSTHQAAVRKRVPPPSPGESDSLSRCACARLRLRVRAQILLLFNDADALTAEQIRVGTGLGAERVPRYPLSAALTGGVAQMRARSRELSSRSHRRR